MAKGAQKSDQEAKYRASLKELADADAYITWAQLRLLLPFGRVTRWRMEREGLFPKSEPVSRGLKGWPAKKILEWFQDPNRLGGIAQSARRRGPPRQD